MASRIKTTGGHSGILNADSPPTLPEFISFPLSDGTRVNLAKKIGHEYTSFGVLLLEDSDGMVVDSIEQQLNSNPERINNRIFQQWLQGKGREPVTWTTLVAVLREIGLRTLAKDIEGVKHVYSLNTLLPPPPPMY